jgi:hypothetical protein
LLKGEIKDGEPVRIVRNGDKLEFTQDNAATRPPADTGVAS